MPNSSIRESLNHVNLEEFSLRGIKPLLSVQPPPPPLQPGSSKRPELDSHVLVPEAVIRSSKLAKNLKCAILFFVRQSPSKWLWRFPVLSYNSWVANTSSFDVLDYPLVVDSVYEKWRVLYERLANKPNESGRLFGFLRDHLVTLRCTIQCKEGEWPGICPGRSEIIRWITWTRITKLCFTNGCAH